MKTNLTEKKALTNIITALDDKCPDSIELIDDALLVLWKLKEIDEYRNAILEVNKKIKKDNDLAKFIHSFIKYYFEKE